MVGFKLEISGIRGNSSTNCATIFGFEVDQFLQYIAIIQENV